MNEQLAIVLQVIGMLFVLTILFWIKRYEILDRLGFIFSIPTGQKAAPTKAPLVPLSRAGEAMANPPTLETTIKRLREQKNSFSIPLGWCATPYGPDLIRTTLVRASDGNGINHIAITGQSDSGKDNLALTMLFSLTTLHSPNEVQICIVDGKGLDFAGWEHKEHTWRLALEAEDIAPTLAALTQERQRRARILRAAQVSKWDSYQARDLPLLVVYISELSLLEDAIGKSELTQWLNSELAAGRAFGIRYIIATQNLSNFSTRWRSQITLYAAGFQPSDSATQPNTNLTSKEIKEAGAIPPSELPPTSQAAGVFTFIEGRECVTARATYISDQERRAWLNTLPLKPLKLSTISKPEVPEDDELLASIIQGIDFTNEGKTGKKPGEIFSAPEAVFSPQESDFTFSPLNFSPAEIAKITAMVMRGKGKTEVVKAMPRYSGKKHGQYVDYYEMIYNAVREADPIAEVN